MLLIDTHILLWWVNDTEALSSTAYSAIEDSLKKSEVLISAISA